MAFQRDRPHCVECAQLLLQVHLPIFPFKQVEIMNGIFCYRCGNVAAILELDEHLAKNFTIFEAAPQEARGVPCKKPQADYFL